METPPLDILYDDGPVLVINKPAGVLTQAPAGIDSLEVRVKDFYRRREGKPDDAEIYLGLPHRLDRPVSGAIVFARHARAAQRLSARLKDKLDIPSAYQKPAATVRVTYADFARTFKTSNPALAPDSVLPFCTGGGRFLREVRVCYNVNGGSQSCEISQVKMSRKSCGQESFLLQSVR